MQLMAEWARDRRARAAMILGALALAAVALWASGALAALAAEATAIQRAMQNALARSVMALRAGEPGAMLWLMAAAGTYGVAHAAGPGHGKALIAAAAAGTRATAARLSAIALAASLAQGAVAVAAIYGAMWLLGGVASSTIARTDVILEPVGHGMLALVGLWLGWRGVRALTPAPAHDHCGCGGCAHGPDPRAAMTADWRAALGLIAGVAVRPCGGAMLTLALAWGAGAPWAGVAAVLAMSLGVAMVTVATAVLAVGARNSALTVSTGGGAQARRVAAALQAGVGALALMIGATGLWSSL
jgi:nickel/cobalt exporter